MTYSETVEFLYHLPVFQHIGANAYKAGLENILQLEEAVGNPHRLLRSVHIAGTNGKGSVSHMTAAVLQAGGYRTGLFTSPHLKDFRERIRIDGQMIAQEAVVEFVARHRKTIERLKPSFFEVTTALAFDYFAREGVDIAVIEVGMGGRLDSTNLIRPLVSVITNISWDHAQFLGDTLEKIAQEKAGIIKEATPVVIGETQPETQLTFIARAKALQAPLLFADQTYRLLESTVTADHQQFTIENRLDGGRFTLTSDLMGSYQRKNILTLLSTLDVLNGHGGLHLSREAVTRGLLRAAASTGLMGRWQILAQAPLTVCDTGHNEGGFHEIVAQLARQHYQKLYMVVGFVADKDLAKVLPLLPREAYYLFTRAAIPRALDESALSQQAAAYGLRGETSASVREAVARARELSGAEDMIFVGGSTFIVSEFL